VCEKILKQITEAMQPGYSKLLINEIIIPDKGAYWQITEQDMVMITLFGSKQTLCEWYDLLESSKLGLKVKGI